MTVVVPPQRAGQRRAGEIVGRGHTLPRRLVHVTVAVDSAGQHDPIARIERLARGTEILADRDNTPGKHADVRPHYAVRQDDFAALNRQIQHQGTATALVRARGEFRRRQMAPYRVPHFITQRQGRLLVLADRDRSCAGSACGTRSRAAVARRSESRR